MTKTVNLYTYLRFCGSIMRTVGPNNHLLLTEATSLDTNGCGMPNNSNFALFLDNGGCCGSACGKMKNWRFYSYGNFGDKNTVFTCLLSSEGCDSFPKHLDLALASNKTNEGVKKQ